MIDPNEAIKDRTMDTEVNDVTPEGADILA